MLVGPAGTSRAVQTTRAANVGRVFLDADRFHSFAATTPTGPLQFYPPPGKSGGNDKQK